MAPTVIAASAMLNAGKWPPGKTGFSQVQWKSRKSTT